MKVESKVIVVTGGGNGMGREIVLNLLSKGAKVIAIDINELALKETVDLSGSNKNSLATFVVDITNREAVENFKEQAIARFGAVDGIINNAGIIQPFVKFQDLSYDVIERVFNVNLWGTVYMTKTFLPHLLTRPEAHIVNISSMGGFLPVPGQTIYGGAKAAVKLITEGLRSELLNSNVRVTVVFPGAINTNIKVNSGLKNAEANTENHSNMALSPGIAADIIVHGMETNKARVMVGKDAKFMDFLVRINPAKASKLIFEKMKSKLEM
jgi:short-subunit dehydrogenase